MVVYFRKPIRGRSREKWLLLTFRHRLNNPCGFFASWWLNCRLGISRRRLNVYSKPADRYYTHASVTACKREQLLTFVYFYFQSTIRARSTPFEFPTYGENNICVQSISSRILFQLSICFFNASFSQPFIVGRRFSKHLFLYI